MGIYLCMMAVDMPSWLSSILPGTINCNPPVPEHLYRRVVQVQSYIACHTCRWYMHTQCASTSGFLINLSLDLHVVQINSTPGVHRIISPIVIHTTPQGHTNYYSHITNLLCMISTLQSEHLIYLTYVPSTYI